MNNSNHDLCSAIAMDKLASLESRIQQIKKEELSKSSPANGLRKRVTSPETSAVSSRVPDV